MNQSDYLEQATFTLSFDAEYFLGGDLMMRVVYIKLTSLPLGSSTINPYMGNFGLATMKAIYDEKSVKSQTGAGANGGAEGTNAMISHNEMRMDLTNSFD